MKLAVGGAAGIFGTSIIYPIDVVKTRLQASSASSIGDVSIKGVIKMILERDGVRGFYRGLSANLSGILFEKGIKLGLFCSLLFDSLSRETVGRQVYHCP